MYRVIYYKDGERRVKTFHFKSKKDLTKEQHARVVEFLRTVDYKMSGWVKGDK